MSDRSKKFSKYIGEFVYFIQNEQRTGPVKIGFTKNLLKRVSTLQSSNMDTLVLIGLIPGGLKLENQILNDFECFCLKGEWFSYEGEFKKFVESLKFNPIIIGSGYEYERNGAWKGEEATVKSKKDRIRKRLPESLCVLCDSKIGTILRTKDGSWDSQDLNNFYKICRPCYYQTGNNKEAVRTSKTVTPDCITCGGPTRPHRRVRGNCRKCHRQIEKGLRTGRYAYSEPKREFKVNPWGKGEVRLFEAVKLYAHESLNYKAIFNRIKIGWKLEDALSIPKTREIRRKRG